MGIGIGGKGVCVRWSLVLRGWREVWGRVERGREGEGGKFDRWIVRWR